MHVHTGNAIIELKDILPILNRVSVKDMEVCGLSYIMNTQTIPVSFSGVRVMARTHDTLTMSPLLRQLGYRGHLGCFVGLRFFPDEVRRES
ncbi:hypothetical protein TNCV_1583541 [Trichonephila clavipes]|nr:hypothetical protein TNCV_1583541 [Trichonephila clavipes]